MKLRDPPTEASCTYSHIDLDLIEVIEYTFSIFKENRRSVRKQQGDRKE